MNTMIFFDVQSAKLKRNFTDEKIKSQISRRGCYLLSYYLLSRPLSMLLHCVDEKTVHPIRASRTSWDHQDFLGSHGTHENSWDSHEFLVPLGTLRPPDRKIGRKN